MREINIIIFCFIFVGFFSFSTPLYALPPLSGTVTVSAQVLVPASAGGSTGIVNYTVTQSVTFSGLAYPLSPVIILSNGQEVLRTKALASGLFSVSLNTPNPGVYVFSVVGEDLTGRRGTLYTFPLSITANVSVTVAGIFLSPTIDIDKSTVRKGDPLTIFGYTYPYSTVTISIHSNQEYLYTAHSDQNGAYSYALPTALLDLGFHNVKAKSFSSQTGTESPFSKLVSFTVANENVQKKEICQPADLNCDGRVNLLDFSIMAYWYKRPNPPAFVDLNHDSIVDIIDFSILAYYWTG